MVTVSWPLRLLKNVVVMSQGATPGVLIHQSKVASRERLAGRAMVFPSSTAFATDLHIARDAPSRWSSKTAETFCGLILRPQNAPSLLDRS